MNNNPIYVTQPSLPPLDEFIPFLEKIWENKILTNGGPMHQLLEQKLAEYLDVPEVVLFNNGMSALLVALKALNITGEVITTPYSFVATTHSIIWNNATPVFVDIDPITLNMDLTKIEKAITEKTQAIMPVHCYGNPCDVEAISQIADKYDLKVIYDAAHAFGVKDKGGSILRHGDLSILSFHATKVFNTFEGGAIICHSKDMKKRINQLKNFGIVNELTVGDVGINGKMSEINAAFGLLQLDYIDEVLEKRSEIDKVYREGLISVKGINVVGLSEQIFHNYSYFPILLTKEYPLTRDELYQKLKDNNIFGRRYFYPLISDFKIYKDLPSATGNNLPIAQQIAQQILCLPIYPSLSLENVKKVIRLIKEA